ncbi:cryptochrome-1-like isoform X2 [Labeo rohita]|uniref:Cryptochrome-1 n=1 Tax=Labeo rohita TaxID=84645 RepID=A0A498M0V8_LABRO|nr:cryptochrome-1-like isoform X2 [Labeo rohita]
MVVNTIHWFRKGLRLHDNPSLRDSIIGADTLRCVYILDPWFAGSSNVGINRWRFLLQCLEDLDASLRKLNSRLFVIRGQPTDVFPRLFKEWKITRLSYEYDSEPFGKDRDAAIKKLATEAGVEVFVRISHTLYDLDKIIELNGGQSPLTYKRFQTLISRMDPVEIPAETITAEVMGKCATPVNDDHDDKFGVPSLEELDGLSSAVWPGGETEALTRLERHLERKAWVANFERPRMNANSLLASPTGLSPYLRFGCLSCRLFYFKLTDLYRKVKKNSVPPLSLYGQLLWREFFYTAATNNPHFDKMEFNPICVQIPWDRNPEALAKWAEGRTGFPWIDAIMTQLRQEGWIHHLARHAVACFLTRGDLWISWEEGMKVFEELLLDADWSVNAGSWMWLSCSSFFQQFFHCYCPVGFGRRTDPNGDYIRRYLPILRGFPAKFIYDPWNAPESVQKIAKCIIGVHYPKPMVNHAEASRINIERMKQIYQQLSCYRGLGLLATVPSNTTNNGDGNGAGHSSGDNTQECPQITVHPSPANSQSEFSPFPVSCDQQSINIVQPRPGYSGVGMVGQAHKQSQRGKKNLVVWGRTSWFSCPETVFPLANCLNVILSRKLSAVPPHAHYLCKDFGSAIHLASEPPLCHIVETIWILGGTEVYKESLEHPWCDLIYLTNIMADFDCDVFFPKFDRNVFRKQKG